MSSYERALELVGKIQAAGLRATADPRAVTLPCVLVTPPGRTYDLACGYTAGWSLIVMAPTTANADTFRLLDQMVDDLSGVVDITTATFISYALSPENPAHPAYRVLVTEGLSWP